MPGTTFGFVPNIQIDTSGTVVQFACTAAEQVGDLVIVSDTLDDTVVRVTSNPYSGLVVGRIVEKGSDTSCRVRIVGQVDDASGLVRGKPVFVGSSGEATTTVPGSGEDLQILGMSTSSTGFVLFPQTQKVVKP